MILLKKLSKSTAIPRVLVFFLSLLSFYWFFPLKAHSKNRPIQNSTTQSSPKFLSHTSGVLNNCQSLLSPDFLTGFSLPGLQATSQQMVQACRSSSCVLTRIVEDIAFHNGAKRKLNTQALVNLRQASSRALEIMKVQGIIAEKAQAQAFTEQGLDPNEIQRYCQ